MGDEEAPEALRHGGDPAPARRAPPAAPEGAGGAAARPQCQVPPDPADPDARAHETVGVELAEAEEDDPPKAPPAPLGDNLHQEEEAPADPNDAACAKGDSTLRTWHEAAPPSASML